MKKIGLVLGFALFLNDLTLFAGLGGQWGHFSSQMKGIGAGFKGFGEGMAESFGMNPPGYYYTFSVQNNTNGTIDINEKRLKKYQGWMDYHGGTVESATLAPGTATTPSQFFHKQIYLSVELGGFYTNNVINMLPAYKKSGITYCFNAYETNAGQGGEFVGTNKETTSAFSASIYNTLSSTQNVTFTYDGEDMSVVLDPETFHMLQSDTDPKYKNSIRPASDTDYVYLDFGSAGKIRIASEGLAVGTKKAKDIAAMVYRYELQGDPAVAYTAGLNPGNYSLLNTQKIRSISPVRCLVWNKGTMAPSPNLLPVNPHNRSVWVGYTTPGWKNLTQTIDGAVVQDTVIAEVPSGQALQFLFIRPSVDLQNFPTTQELTQTNKTITASKTFGTETTVATLGINLKGLDVFKAVKKDAPKTPCAPLFIVSLDTETSTATGKANAKAFMTKLLGLVPGKTITLPKIPSVSSPSFFSNLQSTLLSKQQITTAGQLVDEETGLTGYLLAYDIFTPYGNGPGPFYYSVDPPQIYTGLVMTTLKTFIDKKHYTSPADQAKVTKQLTDWIMLAQAQPTKTAAMKILYPKVLKYLKTNGIDALFKAGDKTKFGWLGNFGLSMLVSGPEGLVNAPILLKSGMNHFPYTQNEMPNTQTSASKMTVTWKPSTTVGLDGKVSYVPSQPVLPAAPASSS